MVAQLRDARHRPALVGFLRAVRVPYQALWFLRRHRVLWPFVIAPAVINVLLFGAGVVLVFTQADAVAGMIWAQPAVQGLLDAAMLVLWYVFYAGVLGFGLVGTYVATLLLGGVLASPFNDVLSGRAETLFAGREAPIESDRSTRGELVASIVSSAAILGFYALLMGPVLLLNVLPGVGSLLATALGVGLGAFFLTLEFADITWARRGLAFREKLRLVRAHTGMTAGFGLSISCLLWIPFLNVLCIPVAVVGGTALAMALCETESGEAEGRRKG